MLCGGCHCGAVRFEVSSDVVHATICHCSDCRKQSGAPMLAWAMVPAGALSIQGNPIDYASSEDGHRSFCGLCGTGLFFSNAVLDQIGMRQVRIAAFDDPEAIAPKMQVQVAERISWTTTIGDLPAFGRFPS